MIIPEYRDSLVNSSVSQIAYFREAIPALKKISVQIRKHKEVKNPPFISEHKHNRLLYGPYD